MIGQRPALWLRFSGFATARSDVRAFADIAFDVVGVHCARNPRRDPSFSCSWISMASPSSLLTVGMTERQMHLHTRRNDDHDAFSLTARCRLTASALLLTDAKTRRPLSSRTATMPSGGRTRLHRGAVAGVRFFAPWMSATVANCGVLRAVRPKLDTPAEGRAGGDSMAAATSATDTRLLRLLHNRLLLRVAEAAPVRPPVNPQSQAIGAARNQRCLIEPGHSDATEIASPLRIRIPQDERAICAAHGGESPSATAYSAGPNPLQFIASTCMPQNACRANRIVSVRTL